MALLPSGTGNLLARNLNLTLADVAHSIDVAFSGVESNVDLGIIDIERHDGTRSQHVFVVMAGMGLDAKMIENTDDDLKSKAGWVAYAKAIVLSLRDPNELHVRFQLDADRRQHTTVHTLILGNCGSLPANILLLPDAKVDDGLFDLMLLRPGGVTGWLPVWFTVAWFNRILRRTAPDSPIGELFNDSNLRHHTGKRLTARLSRPEKIELDGDAFGEATAFNAWMEPGAFTVRVPAPRLTRHDPPQQARRASPDGRGLRQGRPATTSETISVKTASRNQLRLSISGDPLGLAGSKKWLIKQSFCGIARRPILVPQCSPPLLISMNQCSRLQTWTADHS